MSAEEIAQALGGRMVGGTWMACCPVHDDRTPSLSVRDANDSKVLVHCHAGCGQAEVVQALRQRGLWPNSQHQGKIIRPQSRQPARNQPHGEGASGTAAALRIWRSAAPATNTLVETYLRSRGIDIAPPASLRFHPALPHPSGGLWPTMIALVRSSDDEPAAIHRTFLARDGGGKAPVEKQKLMLGPCRAGAVRLGNAHPDGWFVLAEGIETTLSVMKACGLPGWAALSASGLRSLILPPEAAKVLICADNDANGTGQLAARDAAERFLREGRSFSITMPPMTGMDFNDVLSGGKQEAMVEVRHVA
jgi:putative DNA primase/helicase